MAESTPAIVLTRNEYHRMLRALAWLEPKIKSGWGDEPTVESDDEIKTIRITGRPSRSITELSGRRKRLRLMRVKILNLMMVKTSPLTRQKLLWLNTSTLASSSSVT
jgi:hypothetical protein